MTLDVARYERMKAFGAALIASQDLDPLYPVLREIEKDFFSEERALRFTWTYLMYYNLGSALRAAPSFEGNAPVPPVLPTAAERRNLRSEAAQSLHWRDAAAEFDEAGGIRNWFGPGYADEREARERAQNIWGNGRWAAYKWVDLLRHVHGWPLYTKDFGVDGYDTGAGKGLATLYGPDCDLVLAEADIQVRLKADGLDWSPDVIETVLCKFAGHVNGRYEVGHDIHELFKVIWSADFLPLRVRDDTAKLVTRVLGDEFSLDRRDSQCVISFT